MNDRPGAPLDRLMATGLDRLRRDDPELYGILVREHDRQNTVLSLVASSSVVDPSVLASQASVAVNVTAEGYPGRRYHAGCEVVDDIEQLAIDRAMSTFGARYANVQPHSATNANYTVLSALLQPGDTLLGMALDQGGHLTHGSPAAFAGRYFRAVGYGLTEEGLIDYDQVHRLATEHRPRVIICGATAHPRVVDFARFRKIADDAGAYLLADISHTAGLVAAGLHPSPVDHAHITTTCTHKQLFGPRGGLILSGVDHEGPAPRGKGTLADFIQRAVFPFSQGAPAINTIAAKARAFDLVATAEFRAVAERIVEIGRVVAATFADLGYRLVSGGTDNHIVLIDLAPRGMTGLVAERALEECGIIVNKNRVPRDATPAFVTGGIRIGTNSAARRGFARDDAVRAAQLIDRVLRAVVVDREGGYRIPPDVRTSVRAQVADLCARRPLPSYPSAELVSGGS